MDRGSAYTLCRPIWCVAPIADDAGRGQETQVASCSFTSVDPRAPTLSASDSMASSIVRSCEGCARNESSSALANEIRGERNPSLGGSPGVQIKNAQVRVMENGKVRAQQAATM